MRIIPGPIVDMMGGLLALDKMQAISGELTKARTQVPLHHKPFARRHMATGTVTCAVPAR
jgi:hypothetical protein